MTDNHDTPKDTAPSPDRAATSGNTLDWVAGDSTDAQAILTRAREIAQARAAQTGVPAPGHNGQEILLLVDESALLADAPATNRPTAAELVRDLLREARDHRFGLEESCPACGAYPRWADGTTFGCYGCSATSTTRLGALLPLTSAQLREATRLAIAGQRVDIAAALLSAEQVLAGTLRLRFDPRDQRVSPIQAAAAVQVCRLDRATVVVLIQTQTGGTQDQAKQQDPAPEWTEEQVAVTRYDLTGPQPARTVSASASTAPGVPRAAAADLAEFHRTLAAATTTWVRAIPELRGLAAPQLPAQHGWAQPRTPA
jgi:hypothetical protein